MALTWRAGFMVLFAAVQIAVPACMLLDRGLDLRANPFGWQMYSTVVLLPTFKVEFADGSVTPIADDYSPYAIKRAEGPYAQLLPPHLCRQVAGARTVIIEVPPAAPTRYACPGS